MILLASFIYVYDGAGREGFMAVDVCRGIFKSGACGPYFSTSFVRRQGKSRRN